MDSRFLFRSSSMWPNSLSGLPLFFHKPRIYAFVVVMTTFGSNLLANATFVVRFRWRWRSIWNPRISVVHRGIYFHSPPATTIWVEIRRLKAVEIVKDESWFHRRMILITDRPFCRHYHNFYASKYQDVFHSFDTKPPRRQFDPYNLFDYQSRLARFG